MRKRNGKFGTRRREVALGKSLYASSLYTAILLTRLAANLLRLILTLSVSIFYIRVAVVYRNSASLFFARSTSLARNVNGIGRGTFLRNKIYEGMKRSNKFKK